MLSTAPLKVVVTGAKGYLGHPLIDALRTAGHRVSQVDAGFFADAVLRPASRSEVIDTRRMLAQLFAGHDAVIHLAELSNDPLGELDDSLTQEINEAGSIRVAQLAADADVSRFLYFSSCSVYGSSGGTTVDETAPLQPLSAYARAKVRVEAELLKSDWGSMVPVVMRNATAYGPSPAFRMDLAINEFTFDALTTGQIVLRSAGTSWRPFVHTADIAAVACALLTASKVDVGRQVFNVGSDEATITVRHAASLVAMLCGAEVTCSESAVDPRDYRVSFDKLTSLLGDEMNMRPIEDGIADLVSFVRTSHGAFAGRSKDDFIRLASLRRKIASGALDSRLFWTA